MALEQTLWLPYLTEKMRPLDEYRQNSIDETAWIEGKQVIRPIEGDDPDVMLDSTGEQTQTSLAEVEGGYPVHNLRTKATPIEDITEVEVSYERRQSHIDRHSKSLNEKGINLLNYKWSPTLAASIIRTTGVAAATTLVGGTGTRNKITLDDFTKAVSQIEDADFGTDGLNVMMPVQWYRQFLMDNKAELMDLSKYGKAVLQNGELEMLFNVRIWRRGKKNIPRYSNAGTPVPKSPFAVGAATDNACALFWHKQAVSHAMGGYQMYATEDAKMQGWWLSARMRMAGDIIFNDESGVAAIVEVAP
jgi:hypothetical protein